MIKIGLKKFSPRTNTHILTYLSYKLNAVPALYAYNRDFQDNSNSKKLKMYLTAGSILEERIKRSHEVYTLPQKLILILIFFQ